MTSRRPLLFAAALGAAAVLAGCATPASTGLVRAAASVPAPPDISVSPADGTAQVPLDAAVTVTSTAGTLAGVVVTEQGAGTVPGTMSADDHTWTASAGLDPKATYTVTAAATSPAGAHTSTTSSFSTIDSVSNRLLTTVTPADGSTVGVGETIDLRFNSPIAQSQEAEVVKRLVVTSTPAQTGAWHWFSSTEVHYRPETFWSTGTHVTLNANLRGVNAGNGTWGLGSFTSSFTVGAKHISVIDDNTHMMRVYSNDQLLYTWPVSMGKPGFRTLDGTLQVLYKAQTVKMSSCGTFGGAACVPGNANYYDENVYWDTAISTNGFFIHAAPWDVYQQGKVDVSHGCVNLSTDRAITFFNFAIPGDVVQITNSPNIADYTNGEADWQIAFAQYDNTSAPPSTASGSPPPPAY